MVQNRQNYAQDLQISSRGFGSRSTFGVRGLRLIADGIPATMPDGQGQAATFSLGPADRIEVMRGPFSSLYGNSSGGVIQIFTADGPPEPAVTGSFFAGSYDMWKVGLRLGGSSGRLNYIGDASRFETGGYREHSSARRDHLNAKIKFDAGDRGVVTLVVNALVSGNEDPLGLTAAQVAANRRQPGSTPSPQYPQEQSPDAERATYRLDVTGQTARGARLRRRPAGSQHLAIPLATQLATATQSGGGGGPRPRLWRDRLRGVTDRVVGGRSTATAGYDYDRMGELRRGYVNNLRRDRPRCGATRTTRLPNSDVYVQAEWHFAGALDGARGLRHSRVRFESRDFFIVPATTNGTTAAPRAKEHHSGSRTRVQAHPRGQSLWKYRERLRDADLRRARLSGRRHQRHQLALRPARSPAPGAGAKNQARRFERLNLPLSA